MSSIPWDDPLLTDDESEPPPTRPTFLPFPGDPVDLATAAAILNHYLKPLRAELRRVEADIRARYLRGQQAVTVKLWTPQMIVDHWGPELDVILIGFVMLDDVGHRQRFRDVLVLIDKHSGGLVIQDASGLLA